MNEETKKFMKIANEEIAAEKLQHEDKPNEAINSFIRDGPPGKGNFTSMNAYIRGA